MAGRPKEFDRDAALNSATELFWCRGYEASSIAMLLDEMGINRQSAYDTFGDKQALFLKALELYAGRVATELGTVLADGASPLGRVRRFLHVIADRASAGDGKGCLITNTIVELAPHDRQISRFVSNLLRRLEDRLTATLEEARAAGELPPSANARRLARFVLTVMQGALVLAKTDAADAVRDAIAVAEHALAAA